MKECNLPQLEVPNSSSGFESKIIITAVKSSSATVGDGQFERKNKGLYWFTGLAATVVLSVGLLNFKYEQQLQNDSDSIKGAITLFSPYDNIQGFHLAQLESAIFDVVDTKSE